MTFVCRIQIKLNEQQRAILDSQSKICNWLYNHLLETANELRVTYRRTQDDKVGLTLYTQRGLRNLLPVIKTKHPFLCAVHSSPIKNAALRLSDSIQDYQDSRHGQRKGNPTNWPKFRSWRKKWFSLLYDEPNKGFSVNEIQLKLYLGKTEAGKRIRLKLSLTESFPKKYLSRIRSLRVTRDGPDQYFAIFTISEDERIKNQATWQDAPKVVAFDPNHKNLMYGVDTDGVAIEVSNFVHLKKLDTRIDALKSRRDQCMRKSIKVTREDGSFYWKPSRRWTFFNQRLDDAYRVRREQTKTFLYTLANQLFKRYDIVSVGDYTPNGGGITTPMRRAMNNQSLIGRMKITFLWVARRSGRQFIEYNEKGTTRTCYDCRFVMKDGISPNVREWTCPNCGTVHIRDENAAQNGLTQVIQDNHLLPRSGHQFAAKVVERRVWWVASSGVFSASRGCDGSALPDTTRKLKRRGCTPAIQMGNV